MPVSQAGPDVPVYKTEIGAKVLLKKQHQPAPLPAEQASKIWESIVQIAKSEEEPSSEFVDEDQLLEHDSNADVVKAMDCGPSDANSSGKKKKACKNCSCGLAEEELQETLLSTSLADKPKSSCGSVSQMATRHATSFIVGFLIILFYCSF